MEFRILGPLEVVEAGNEVAPRRAKQRALLAVLLLRANDAVTTDELVDALWGERPPPTAQTALHGHVSALRKQLGAERIETTPGGYLLRAEPSEIDAGRFESLVAEADGTDDAETKSRLLTEALDLWRGDPLGEFRYDGFAQPAIARLEDLRLSALERRIDADLELGRHGEIAADLEQLVREHPLRERLREQLMLALYRSGRQADALHAYREGRRVLSEELGLDPGPSLQSLERRILADDPSLEFAPGEAPPAQQVRKTVTVLVMELVSADIDPEDFDDVVQPALARARTTFEEFGATVDPLFANALVATFGAPRAHEDDTERAVGAASRVMQGFAADENVTVRVGIHRGEALVTTTGDQVEITGDVLIEASRLQATAGANDVVLSEAVRRVLATTSSSHEVAFVGREHELGLLEHVYERVVGENAVQLVTIAGEPGSGKTRLAKEFQGLLEREARHAWLEGRCLPYGEGVTFWALGEIVKGAATILESDDLEASTQKLNTLLSAVLPESDDRTWVEANVSALVGVAGSPNLNRHESFAAWRRFLESLAEREPLVLLVEDLHWGDSALLEFVDDVVDRAAGVPLLVICTARLELLDAQPSWAGGKRNATTITLPPLSPDETRELARSVLRTSEPSDALVSRAGGNPLFAQELARWEGTEAGVLPESLHGVIAARLDTLAPAVKAAAMDAAVVGEVFWSGALAEIASIDERDAEDRLHRLVTSDIVRRARASSVTGENEYMFLHVLVRDVAYSEIPKRKRAEKHARVAAWIEQLAGERITDHAELIAHHYGAALELARASGDDARALAAKTRRFLVLAGDRAMQLDIATAARFYSSALELFEEVDDERVDVILALARAAQEAGRLEESIRLSEEAIVELRRRDDPLKLGRALLDYELALWRYGKSERRGTALAEAVGVLEREPPGPELAEAYGFMARHHMVAGRATKALGWSERATGLAMQLGLERLALRALQFRGVARCALNDLDGLQDLRESLRLGLDVGAGIETGVAYVNLGEWLFWTEGPAPCLELFEQGIEFSERHGLEHNAYWLRMDKLRRLFDLGRWDELLDVVDEILAWERSRGETQITTTALIDKTGVIVRRGAVSEAKALVDTWLEPARNVNDPQVLVPALVCAALVEHEKGEDPIAIQRLEELQASTDGRAPIWRALCIADVARICAATDALELAKRLTADLDVVAARHVYGVLSARAAVAEADGRLEDALRCYEEAFERWHQFGHVLEEGHALLGRARCCAVLGRYDEAKEPIEAARATFDRLGAVALVAETERVREELLSRASGS